MAAVRRAEPGDAAALARIRVETWRATYRGIVPDAVLDGLDVGESRARWERTLKGEGASGLHVYVMEDQGGPVGYVGVGPERGSLAGHPGEVFMLYVEPGQHGRGFGKKLLCRGLSDLAGRGLLPAVVWVLHDNPARSFYEHMGGQYLTRQDIEIGQPLVEDAYSFTAWPAGP